MDEVTIVASELSKLKLVAGEKYKANIAVLQDYNNEWDGELDLWYGPFIKKSTSAWFEGLQRKHIPMDILQLRVSTTLEELSKYDTLVYPHAAILTEETASLLYKYAENGGTLIFGCRTGYKDIQGRCLQIPMPGYARRMTDTTINDFTFIGVNELAPKVDWNGQIMNAVCFNDILSPGKSAKVLGRFDSNYYEAKPALTVNNIGKGYVYYYGAVFDLSAVNAFITNLNLSFESDLVLPEQVELAVRGEYSFLLNYKAKEASIELRGEYINVLDDRVLSGKVQMSGFGVLVLKGHS